MAPPYWSPPTEPSGPGSEYYHDKAHSETTLLILQHSRGAQESPSKTTLPNYDPKCYLCPGNERAQGDTNPNYESTFVFVNDYSAVKEEQAAYEPSNEDGTSSCPAHPHQPYQAHKPQNSNRGSSKPSP